MDALFDIERAINGLDAGERLRVRQEQSRPLLTALEAWLRDERSRLSRSASVVRSIICSGAGIASPASSTTAEFASRTMLPSGRSEASLWDENRGCSPVPNAALPGQPPCPRSLRRQSSTMSIRWPGWPTCSRASPASHIAGFLNCYRGNGESPISKRQPPEPWQRSPTSS